MYEIKEIEDTVKIISNGKEIKEFEIKDNLDRALELFNQLNNLKNKEGKAIYSETLFEGKSLWSFHQTLIFHNFLRVYAKYEDVVRFLHEKSIDSVKFNGSRVLRMFLMLSGVSVKPKQREIAYRLFDGITLMISKIVTYYKIFILSVRKNTHVLIYTPDRYSSKHGCDFRFYPVYEYLKQNGIKYVEIFPFTYWRDLLSNIIKRKRCAIYLEAFFQTYPARLLTAKKDRTSWILNCEGHNVKFFESLLSIFLERSQRSKKLVGKLAKIFRKTGIKVFAGIDDVRYVNEIILACNKAGVKSYGFQHGHFTKYHVGWYNYGIPEKYCVAFDKLFVWNEYWKNVLLRYSNQYNEKNVAVCGLFREIPQFKISTNHNVKDFKDVSVLIPYEVLAPLKEVREYINRFLELGAKVYFKIRPDIDVNKQIKEYTGEADNSIKPVTEVDEHVLNSVNLVAGCYSTFLNEMIFYDKPVVIFKTSNTLGHQLVDDGLAIQVDLNSMDKILEYIRNYESKKKIAWPQTEENLRSVFEKIFADV